MPAVDCHAHVFSPDCPVLAGARYVPAYAALTPDWTGLWPQAQVSHGVLVQPSFLGVDNRYLLEQLRAQPERMRGVVVVEPDRDAAPLGEWDEAGVRGVRLNLIGIGDFAAYAQPGWRSLFDAMAELGWHLEIQCEGERLARLLQLLEGTPPALVFDHFGLPDPRAGGDCAGVSAILHASARRRVYVKLSAPYRLRGADAQWYAQRYLAELGAERLLWGSDWPWTNHEIGREYVRCRGLLDAWIADAAARRRILWDTPRELYGFSS